MSNSNKVWYSSLLCALNILATFLVLVFGLFASLDIIGGCIVILTMSVLLGNAVVCGAYVGRVENDDV